jgi:hypothetical protein
LVTHLFWEFEETEGFHVKKVALVSPGSRIAREKELGAEQGREAWDGHALLDSEPGSLGLSSELCQPQAFVVHRE